MEDLPVGALSQAMGSETKVVRECRARSHSR